MRVAGIDGTKKGWVAVVLEDGHVVDAELLFPIESEFPELAEAQVLAIDVPIGFGPRLADSAARKFLVGASSTVFSTPTREVLEMPFGPGLGVSAQAHALGPRVRHVTRLARIDTRLKEVHPEVSFRAMNDGRPLRYRKKSAGGVVERLVLLEAQGIRFINGDIGSAALAPVDDVLDAAAAAWTASRISQGFARCLPDPPEQHDGLQIAIWY